MPAAKDLDRETVEQPADWRRAAWGAFIATLGVGLVLSTAGTSLSLEATRFGAGMLLLGLAVGWTDPLAKRQQQRLSTRLRNLVSRT